LYSLEWFPEDQSSGVSVNRGTTDLQPMRPLSELMVAVKCLRSKEIEPAASRNGNVVIEHRTDTVGGQHGACQRKWSATVVVLVDVQCVCVVSLSSVMQACCVLCVRVCVCVCVCVCVGVDQWSRLKSFTTLVERWEMWERECRH
jgi:hypothetical protein